jgi:hypothetical protein
MKSTGPKMTVPQALEMERTIWNQDTSALNDTELLRLTRLGEELDKAAQFGNAANLEIRTGDAQFLLRLLSLSTTTEEEEETPTDEVQG